MKNKFIYLLGFSALMLVGVSAYFSIIGFSKLFSAEFYPIIIMVGSLELAKLVTASYLYRYWDSISAAFKTYLIIAVVSLMIITSAGVYGFLSAAYSSTSSKLNKVDGQIELLNKKKEIFQNNIIRLNSVIENKNNRTNTLSSIRSNQEARIDTLYKKGRTTKSVENIIKESNVEIDKNNIQIDLANQSIQSNLDSINSIEMKLLDCKNSDIKGEIGPLKYIALLTNYSIDSVVNFFILIIMLVCDPLAVCLVIAFNNVSSLKEKGSWFYSTTYKNEK